MPDCCARAVESYSVELATDWELKGQPFHKAVFLDSNLFHVERLKDLTPFEKLSGPCDGEEPTRRHLDVSN